MVEIKDILVEIVSARKSQAKQITDLHHILEKSNSVLLELDNDHTTTTNKVEATPTLYAYRQETFQTLARVLQKFHEFQNQKQSDAVDGITFEEFLSENGQTKKILDSSVRKLLAIYEIVEQMKLKLQEEKCCDDEAHSDEEPDLPD